MKKKKSTIAVSSLQEVLARAKKQGIARTVKDSEIDFSDIPELTPEQLDRMVRPGRPLISLFPRKAISIRIDQDVLAKLKKKAKKQGIPYQSLINDILKKAV
ncbi:BrnA antitoxin family protein [Bdellovibrio sp. HCB209]|uniref:BrnA antitoxin family protein n=1 Tax=Bdellovibrio sp. HCB209 TaxID=3394354 RepID=UPI0039B517A3